jgi:hypothetical protein
MGCTNSKSKDIILDPQSKFQILVKILQDDSVDHDIKYYITNTKELLNATDDSKSVHSLNSRDSSMKSQEVKDSFKRVEEETLVIDQTYCFDENDISGELVHNQLFHSIENNESNYFDNSKTMQDSLSIISMIKIGLEFSDSTKIYEALVSTKSYESDQLKLEDGENVIDLDSDDEFNMSNKLIPLGIVRICSSCT